MLPRTVSKDVGYCSEWCLRYLGRQQYSGVAQQPVANFGNQDSRSTINFEQNTIEHAFLQKLVEIKNQEVISQNNEAPLNLYKDSTKEIQFMHELTEEQNNRNHYPLSQNPGSVTQPIDQLHGSVNEKLSIANRFAAANNARRQLEDRNGVLHYSHDLNLGIEEKTNSNAPSHDNVESRYVKQTTKLNGDAYNIISVQESLNEQSHLDLQVDANKELTADQVGDSHKKANTSVRHQVDPEKAVVCARLNCTLGDWTGAVCACNHVTGKVASFRHECDLAKHNCRFDTGKCMDEIQSIG